jgi:uncharacterized membrane protein
MGILLGLLAALAYGAGDFTAGVGGRRVGAGSVTVVVQALGVVTAGIAVLLFRGQGPEEGALIWGAISGVGSAVGTLALYRGLTIGQMSVVAPLSAVVTALLPVIVGLALGEYLSLTAKIGVGVAFPALVLVSWRPATTVGANPYAGVIEGFVSGAGFALLFIALDQAGTDSGAWPLVPGQAVALLLVLPFGFRPARQLQVFSSTMSILVAAGLLGGVANLLFLAATNHGQLSIIAVLTALYPAVTILLARLVLGERWTNLQKVGLMVSAVAVGLISGG